MAGLPAIERGNPRHRRPSLRPPLQERGYRNGAKQRRKIGSCLSVESFVSRNASPGGADAIDDPKEAWCAHEIRLASKPCFRPRRFPRRSRKSGPPNRCGDPNCASGGATIKSPWLWVGSDRRQPEQLWLPLDVLVGRFGFQRQQSRAGEQLEWYGKKALLSSLPQRTIDDEVGIDVSRWLSSTGVRFNRSGKSLSIELPAPQVTGLRRGKGSTANRLVLDLNGPVFVQRQGNDLLLGLRATPTQEGQLQAMGLKPRRRHNTLTLEGQATVLSTLTLSRPWRIVLDGLSTAGQAPRRGRDPFASSLLNPTIQGLMRRGLVLDRRVVKVGVKPLDDLRVGT